MACIQRSLFSAAIARNRTARSVSFQDCSAFSSLCSKTLHTSAVSLAQEAPPSTGSSSSSRSSSFPRRPPQSGAPRTRPPGGPSSGGYSNSGRSFPSSSSRSGPRRKFGPPGGAGGRFRGGPGGGRDREPRKPKITTRLPPYEEWLKSEDAKKWRQPPTGTRGPFWVSDTVRLTSGTHLLSSAGHAYSGATSRERSR